MNLEPLDGGQERLDRSAGVDEDRSAAYPVRDE